MGPAQGSSNTGAVSQADDEGQGRQQRQTHDQRQRYPDPAHPGALMFRQLVRQDRDENQVVDAKHDLHHNQCDKRRPCGGIAE
jgi:hypothetical protein